jgi:uncharacterized protein YdiU (UPF0061 family)
MDSKDNLIGNTLTTAEKVLLLAHEFRSRLASLVANWIRVGFCQGNFNSDNCAVGGFTLDYGPFGFCDVYDPHFQSWTGGGHHFSFMNQPVAAQQNFKIFYKNLEDLDQDWSRWIAKWKSLIASDNLAAPCSDDETC